MKGANALEITAGQGCGEEDAGIKGNSVCREHLNIVAEATYINLPDHVLGQEVTRAGTSPVSTGTPRY